MCKIISFFLQKHSSTKDQFKTCPESKDRAETRSRDYRSKIATEIRLQHRIEHRRIGLRVDDPLDGRRKRRERDRRVSARGERPQRSAMGSAGSNRSKPGNVKF